MTTYNSYRNKLEQFLQTERGKRFINFAYSFGAAIVILGAMFKLLHFPFGNEMLFIGMATECIVFILSAFDTPARDYTWEHTAPPAFESKPINEMPLSLSAYTDEHTKQLETLNRTLSGLNSLYEMQLKSAGSQLSSLEQINQGLNRLKNVYGDHLPDNSAIRTETEKMAHQLKELNDVYARMLSAMTVDSRNPNTNTNS